MNKLYGLAIVSLIVSIVSAVIAIISFRHAIKVRNETKNENKETLEYIEKLITNAAQNPDKYRKMLEAIKNDIDAEIRGTNEENLHINYTITIGTASVEEQKIPLIYRWLIKVTNRLSRIISR